jgi:hypothetical protein
MVQMLAIAEEIKESIEIEKTCKIDLSFAQNLLCNKRKEMIMLEKGD